MSLSEGPLKLGVIPTTRYIAETLANTKYIAVALANTKLISSTETTTQLNAIIAEGLFISDNYSVADYVLNGYFGFQELF